MKVRTGRPPCACIRAATVEESIPPESSAEGHVGDHLLGDDVPEQAVQSLDGVRIVPGEWVADPLLGDPPGRPVGARRGEGARGRSVDGQDHPRRELVEPLVDRVRCRNVIVAQEQGDGTAVELAAPAGVLPQSLELRPEQQRITHAAIIEGLLADTVADQMEQPLPPVPEGEGEHPHAPPDRLVEPPALDGRQQDLSVGLAAEGRHRPVGSELAPQRPEVVDLSIEGDYVAAAGRVHRLMAVSGEVDDRQAAEPEGDTRRRVGPGSSVVWAPRL